MLMFIVWVVGVFLVFAVMSGIDAYQYGYEELDDSSLVRFIVVSVFWPLSVLLTAAMIVGTLLGVVLKSWVDKRKVP